VPHLGIPQAISVDEVINVYIREGSRIAEISRAKRVRVGSWFTNDRSKSSNLERAYN